MGQTVLKSNLIGPHVPSQPLAVRLGHAPEPVRRPGPAGDPDGRPRPRHVLARPRRRDGRRAGRLRLDRQPVRRQPPLRARARARHRRARRASRTEIHRFDVSDPTKTVYKASGSVPGFILNNYALSELNGDLRVASTEDPPWQTAGPAAQSSSRVTVLRQEGNKLNQVGAVGGLGEGERIFGVRFMGERGYVVTFRQTDPLYTLDLSRPDRAQGRRRAEDPGLLGLPAPGRREPAARHRARGAERQGVAVRRLEHGRAARGHEPAVRQQLHDGRERAARVPVLGAEEARR